MRKQIIVLASVLATAPLSASGADLVVWWEDGFYAEEDKAIADLVAAFEHKTGK